jgi:hypothetical protein
LNRGDQLWSPTGRAVQSGEAGRLKVSSTISQAAALLPGAVIRYIFSV